MRITLAALDFETSGTFAATEGEPELENQPIQIGIALWNPPLPRPKAVARDYLKHTSRITHEAYQVHKISWKDTRNGRPLAAFWPVFQELLQPGTYLVAHNAPGERKILKKAFPLADFSWIDTLTVSRATFPEEEIHELPACVGRFPEAQRDLARVCPDLTWHDALYDAAAALCFLLHAWRGPLRGHSPQRVQNLSTETWKNARARRQQQRAAGAPAQKAG